MPVTNPAFVAETQTILETAMALAPGFTMMSVSKKHADKLARLWYLAYPPDIAPNLNAGQEAVAEFFSGECGPLWPEASPLIYREERLVAAALTVHRPPWEQTPLCPFIVDLIVDPDFRKQGLATVLLIETARAVSNGGKSRVGLRVLRDNTPAVNLYRKLGFQEWDGKPLSSE